MTEEKSTTKKTTAAKKSTTATTAATVTAAAPPAKALAAKKAAPAVAEKRTSEQKAVQTALIEAEVQAAPTECAALPERTATEKPSPEERYRMVQSAAYFIAENDGFQGCDTDYWARAESEIAAQLGEA